MCVCVCMCHAEASPGFCAILETLLQIELEPQGLLLPFLLYFHYEREVNHAESDQRLKDREKEKTAGGEN